MSIDDPSLEQTRKSQAFNHKLWVIPLKPLDIALGVLTVGFIVLVIADTLSRFPAASAYTLFRELHAQLGLFTLLLVAVVLLVAIYIGGIRGADVTPYFRRGVYLILLTLVFESAIGLVLYAAFGTRPSEAVHLVYGVGAIVALPFFIFVERTAQKRPAMGTYIWGFGLLAGIILRTLSTGAVT